MKVLGHRPFTAMPYFANSAAWPMTHMDMPNFDMV